MLRRGAFALLLAAATVAAAEPPARLSHRVWLLAGVPDEAVLQDLRSVGVDALVLPVGDVEIGEGSTRFTMRPLPDLKPLAGWSVASLVWVSGHGKAAGDAGKFWTQAAPVRRMLPGAGALVLATREYFEGLPRFAAEVARRAGEPVGLALPVRELAAHLPEGGWPRVEPVGVALGNPQALGFPPSTVHDDLSALEILDGRGVPYRPALVVAPRVSPVPGSQPVSLALITRGSVAAYSPGARGDVFTLRLPVDWGGTRLETGQRIEVDVVDTARYHRDLGLVMRPVRMGLIGWDTVGMPAAEPALGMSREAFLDYLRGGMPYPTPDVEIETTGATVRVELRNPSPNSSAIATTGNWVEVHFTGSEVREVNLGEFSGVHYGRLQGDVFKDTVARDATVVRLYVPFLAPRSRVSGGTIAFMVKPRSMAVRWALRLGDGRDVIGPIEPRDLTKR